MIYNFLYSMLHALYTLCHMSYRFNVIYAKDGTIRDAHKEIKKCSWRLGNIATAVNARITGLGRY